MAVRTDDFDGEFARDDAYFDDGPRPVRTFDARLLEERVTLLPHDPPLVFGGSDSVKEAMQAMQQRHRGCVLITADGTLRSELTGIFTERDILLKVIDCGRNPATLALSEVMTTEPESLGLDARLAWALNMMSIGGYRHLPITDDRGFPAFVLSVRDIVEFLVDSFPSEILNLPPDFTRPKLRTRDGA